MLISRILRESWTSFVFGGGEWRGEGRGGEDGRVDGREDRRGEVKLRGGDRERKADSWVCA